MKKLKYYEEGDNLRLTFDWPDGVDYIHISPPTPPRLFTLQEYIKFGGLKTPKLQGLTTYYIQAGEEESCLVYENKTAVNFVLERRAHQYNLTLSCDYHVPPDVVFYKKNNGMVYPFSEEIFPGEFVTRVIQVKSNEQISLFIKDEKSLFKLCSSNETRNETFSKFRKIFRFLGIKGEQNGII